MIPQPLDAVVFDMDGLLLDTEGLYRTAIFASAEELGHVMTDDVHLSMIGIPTDIGNELLRGHFGEAFDLATFQATCKSHFERLSADAVPLRPGAMELIQALRERRIPMAVATSTSRQGAERHLGKAGILPFLDALVTRSDVTNGKPHPESYLKAAAALNARPASTLALEDSYNGVRAAAAAGLATIMIPDLLPATDEMRALAVGILSSLHEVAALLP